MEPWNIPVEEVHLKKVDRTGDRNASTWHRQQQLQRWKTHMQRLGQALEEGNLEQARREFEALINDAPEIGQVDPMAHPQFAVLGKSLQHLDLESARAAFCRLQDESPLLRHRQPSGSSDEQATSAEPVASAEKPDNTSHEENTGRLDITV